MNNKKLILPYGDALRELLNDPGITKADLKNVLRRRGVFICNEEKSSYVVELTRTGLVPSELIEIQDKIRIKEENIKYKTQSIKWAGGSKSLLQCLPKDINVNEIVSTPFSNFKVLGIPSFKPVDGNQDLVEMSFSIERYDYTKSWDKNTSQFSGKVRFKKENDSISVNINLSHTSPETKKVATDISRFVVKHFKNENLIDNNESIIKIKFNDFENKNRVLFLKELSQNQRENELYFKDTKDIGFIPEKGQTLPSEISWLQENVSNLTIQGKELHSTFFIKNKENHDFIKIHKLEAAYRFNYLDFNGNCRVVFEFPEVVSKEKDDSELTIKISQIGFNKKSTSILTSIVKETLLSHLDNTKMTLYEKYKKECNKNLP